MWVHSNSGYDENSSGRIEPNNVLYFFDEPLIFTANFDGVECLVLKVDEDDSGEISLYLSVPTNRLIVQMLLDGKISTRSAFMQPFSVLLEARDLEIQNAWKKDTSELPDAYFPEPHCGLYPQHGKVFDRHLFELESDPFLGMYFSGGELSRSIPLGDLKGIIDNTYTLLNRMFRSAFDNYIRGGVLTERGAGKAFQIPVREPKFASLSLEIDEPHLTLSAVKQRALINAEAVKKEMLSTNGELIQSMDDLVSSFSDANKNFDYDKNFSFLTMMQSLIPDDNTPYDNIEFSGSSVGKKLILSREEGKEVKEIYKTKVSQRNYVEGTVVEVNNESQTFLLKPAFGKVVTCDLSFNLFKLAHMNLVFSSGSGEMVKVFGDIRDRQRRGFAVVKRIEFADGQEFSR